MTREEAIEVMKAYRDKVINSVSNQLDGDIEAFDMAINTLTALEKIYAELERTMNDYKTDLMHFIPLLCVKETLDKYTKGEGE